MSKLYSQLKINLHKLNTGDLSVLEADFETILTDIGIKNFIENADTKVLGHYRIFKDKSDIVLIIKAEADILLNCSRCLKVFPHKISINAEILVDENSEYFVLITDNNQIDIAPIIRDYLLAAVPIKNICNPDCKGLCSNCGIDLNISKCKCDEKDKPESPFAVLKDFKLKGRNGRTKKENFKG